MSTLSAASLAAVAAALVSLALCRAVMELGLRDAPDGLRKLQASPVPSAGGLGFAPAVLACALIAAGLVEWRVSGPVAAAAAAASGCLIVGALDDVFDLAARLKLVLLAGISVAAVAGGLLVDRAALVPGVTFQLPMLLGAAGSLLWLLVVINAVNFMDGANGLAMGMGAVAFAGLGVVSGSAGLPDIALLSAAAAGGLCGFLVWNAPGRLYAGDAGALFAGALFAGLSLALVKARPDLLLAPPLLAAPFLVDVILTVVWRARRGRDLMSAHRDHVYQVAIRAGLGHPGVAVVHGIGALNAAAVATAASFAGGWTLLFGFIGVYAVGVYVHLRVRRSAEARGLTPGRDAVARPVQ